MDCECLIVSLNEFNGSHMIFPPRISNYKTNINKQGLKDQATSLMRLSSSMKLSSHSKGAGSARYLQPSPTVIPNRPPWLLFEKGAHLLFQYPVPSPYPGVAWGAKTPFLVTSKHQSLSVSKNELCTQESMCNVISIYNYIYIYISDILKYLGDWCATSRCLTWPKARIINSSHVNVS